VQQAVQVEGVAVRCLVSADAFTPGLTPGHFERAQTA
jgi:hypothetical protein